MIRSLLRRNRKLAQPRFPALQQKEQEKQILTHFKSFKHTELKEKDRTTVYQNAGNYMPEGGMGGGGGKTGAEESFEVLFSRNLD